MDVDTPPRSIDSVPVRIFFLYLFDFNEAHRYKTDSFCFHLILFSFISVPTHFIQLFAPCIPTPYNNFRPPDD